MQSLLRIMLVSTLMFATQAVKADFSHTEGYEKKAGLIETFVDHDNARVFLALDKPDSDGVAGRYIYAAYLTGGLGSNPVGLDRSVPTESQILAFKKAGSNIVAVIENTRFRASADNPAEKRAVETSFAQSIIWSTPIIETEVETGRVLIDVSDFLLRDAVGVSARLSARGQGNFRVANDRSYVDTKAAFAFPINLEFDAYVTFAGSKPGNEIVTTTPDPSAVTLIAHTTFMKLPEEGYEIRYDDERAGIISTSHIDMSAPLTGDTVVRFARRFRLQKDAAGNVINPIVFYIDNGAPEPIRGALLEGARWWSDAFDAAGFKGGYKAEILPEGVHPLDARYNVVNWVHRATRGWSYGAAMHDPRTGETLRGVVLLGSLRVRQDIKIFEALAGAAKTGTGEKDDPVEIALARIRQLSAHEIGHSLGFAHNMAASTYGDRASVMDYPAPDVRAGADGKLDFSRAYGVGVGSWDMWTVNFLYSDYGNDSDAVAQAKLVAEADRAGLIYVSDGDSRNPGTGHVKGALWDTGADAIESLANTMRVRDIALKRFGLGNLRSGERLDALQTKFVPLYLYHRYQLQAAAKYLGGLDFSYRHEGDGRASAQIVSWARQKQALDALLATLMPEALEISDDVLANLSPLGFANGDPQFGREGFVSNGRPQFDLIAAVRAASDISLQAILHPQRVARLVEQGARVSEHPGLAGVLDGMTVALVRSGRARMSDKHRLIHGAVKERFVSHLINLAQSSSRNVGVRDAAMTALLDVKKRVTNDAALYRQIEDALKRAGTPAVKQPSAPSVPPGSPIGAASAESCWHCAPANIEGIQF